MVWEALNQNGPSTVTDIMKATSLKREEVFGALGWLGREHKISVEMRGERGSSRCGPDQLLGRR